MRYVMARMQEYSRDLSYRIYVSDALKATVENTKYHLSMDGMIAHGVQIEKRWIDNFVIQQEESNDTRTCEEVVSDIWSNAGFSKRA